MKAWVGGVVGAALLLRCGVGQAPIERRRPTAAKSAGVQAPQGLGDETPTIEVQSRLVNVPVTVVDAGGVPVGGLDKADFAVAENGRPQPIAVFERESATPLSIVLAIDASETVLTSARLEREAAKHFVRALLRAQDELDLMDFSDTVREVVPFTNDRARIDRGLGDIVKGDETALYDAVYLAADRLGQTSAADGRRRVMVVISDGGDSKNKSTYRQAVEQAQRAGAAIFAIIVVPVAADAGRNTGGEHALIQMADDTGGRYYYVEDPKQLDRAFGKVSEDLRTQYVLGYYAPRAVGDEGLRRITVSLTRPALAAASTLRYRKGYYSDGR